MNSDPAQPVSGFPPEDSGCAIAPTPVRAIPPEAIRWELCGRAHPDSPMHAVLVSTQPFTVGREVDNTLCLANPTISRRHAELMLIENDLFVRDLGSRNGTFLNGRRVVSFDRLCPGDTLQFGGAVYTIRLPQDGPEPDETGKIDKRTIVDVDIADYALGNLQFDRLLRDSAAEPHFQPIVTLGNAKCIAYEVLARSRLPGLENPELMFRIASERKLEAELSDVFRAVGLRSGKQLGQRIEFYLNTHPNELGHPGLYSSLERLRNEFPDSGIVLEIHEAAVTSSQVLARLRSRLRDLNMRLAYDDFGAGQSRLMELVDVPPDVLKFDRRLIQGLPNASAERQNMVRSLLLIVRDLAVIPLAEGVETADEAAVCRQLGFELAQGYYFGRPASAPSLLPAKPAG